MTSVPLLSVVMPARNVGRFVDEAVGSILSQTYSDFEFVILDDASTDDTREKLCAWSKRDPRIHLYCGSARLGPAGSSNFVVETARASLIARMDADDVARPERLARQMALLGERPDMVLVGTLHETMDARGRIVRNADHGRLLRRSAFAPFSHSSILFRRDAFEQVSGYRPAADKWEDLDLYLRLADRGAIATLNTVLMCVRQSSASTRIADGSDGLELAMERLNRCLSAYRQDEDYTALMELVPDRLSSPSFLSAASCWLWAGERQDFSRRLRERVVSPTVAALLWAKWADLSPASLRAALRMLLRLRNTAATARIGRRPYVQWFPQPESSKRLSVGESVRGPSVCPLGSHLP